MSTFSLHCRPPRLLSQLDETERAFDEFWVRHQTKLEQCLQLRHFEHDYREVSRIQILPPHTFLTSLSWKILLKPSCCR